MTRRPDRWTSVPELVAACWLMLAMSVSGCGSKSHWYRLCPGEDAAGDGEDQDCDGADGVDSDGDGHASIGSGGDDCDDSRVDLNPAVAEMPGGALAPAVPIFETGLVLSADIVEREAGAIELLSLDPGGANIARLEGGQWSVARVDLGLGPYSVVSGRIGPDSSVRYAHDCAEGLCYATNESGGFVEEVVDEEAPSSILLMLDRAGEPAIVAMRAVEGDLFDLAVLRPVGGAWLSEDLASGLRGQALGSAIDAGGGLHIVYQGPDPQSALAYATDSSGEWQTSPLPVRAPCDLRAMAVDDAGAPYVVASTEGGALLLTVRNGDWETRRLPYGPPYGPGLSPPLIRIGLDQTVHLLTPDTADDAWMWLVGRGEDWTIRMLSRSGADSAAWFSPEDGLHLIGAKVDWPEDCWEWECPTTVFSYFDSAAFDENCDGIAE